MIHKFTASTLALSLCVSLLSGCGGGGGDSSTSSSSLSISGIAATGAALSGATVTAKCASGTGTTTQATSNSGSYTITITSGTLPCVLEASDGITTLHSVTTSSTANITPLTELLVAQLTGTDPSTYMSSLNTSTLSSVVTSSTISTAQTAVISVLTNAGVDTSALTDIVTGNITAGSGSGYDGVLDALGTALSGAGSTLSTLTTTVASSSASASSTTASSSDSSTSALAPELLLKAAASDCDALRATNYWIVFSGRTGSTAIGKFKVLIDTANSNSAAIQFYTSAGSSTLGSTYALTSSATCRFTSSANDDIVVSPSGIVAGRTSANEAFVAVPVQSHTLDDMVGSWNMIGGDTAEGSDTGWTHGYATMTISSSGYEQITQGCWFEATTSTTCTTVPDDVKALQRPFTALSDGSFQNQSANNDPDSDGGPWTDRLFVYKTGKGDYFAISANTSTPDSTGDGSVAYATKVRTLSLPSVTSTASSSWVIAFNWTTGLAPNDIDVMSHTISSIDSSANSFVRVIGSDGGATHSETIFINSPYDGFSFRDYLASTATSLGGTTTVRTSYMLKGGSSGITISLLPYLDSSRPAKINISVAQPTS